MKPDMGGGSPPWRYLLAASERNIAHDHRIPRAAMALTAAPRMSAADPCATLLACLRRSATLVPHRRSPGNNSGRFTLIPGAEPSSQPCATDMRGLLDGETVVMKSAIRPQL